MGKIKYFVMDVDGTLTDGKIYMGQNGESFKAFNIKDGAGIALVLPEHGIIPVIITARESRILENRCRELNISEFHQGSQDKFKTLIAILSEYGAGLDSVAYAGDDLPDLPCMEAVKNAGGVVVCPSDAVPEVKMLSEYISGYKAGEGAVRDCINYLIQRDSLCAEERIKQVISWIQAEGYKTGAALPDGCTYTIQEYMTKPEDECVIESHRNHFDIQYMIEGHEMFKIYTNNCLTSTGEYSEEKDVEFLNGGTVSSQIILVPGSMIIVHNNQPHKGAIIDHRQEKVKKLVCKIRV